MIGGCTDTQTFKQTDNWTDADTCRQIDWQTKRRRFKHTERLAERYRQADKQTDIRKYAGTGRYLVRQTENRTDTEAVKQSDNQSSGQRD